MYIHMFFQVSENNRFLDPTHFWDTPASRQHHPVLATIGCCHVGLPVDHGPICSIRNQEEEAGWNLARSQNHQQSQHLIIFHQPPDCSEIWKVDVSHASCSNPFLGLRASCFHTSLANFWLARKPLKIGASCRYDKLWFFRIPSTKTPSKVSFWFYQNM